MMADSLEFSDEVNHALKMAYQTPDIVSARAKVVTALKLHEGQHVLDIGSGPGLLARDISQNIGASGSVTGVDMAGNMIDSARKLCDQNENVTFEQGDAMSLPFADNSFDAVVSTQVYEYVPDLNIALAEFARVLRLGGRGVIVDTDWAFPYWNAVDGDCRDSMINAWKGHCAQESVPMRLTASIKSAGLQLNTVEALPIMNTQYNENNFSYWLSKIIASFAKGRDGLTQSDSEAWLAGLDSLEKKGEYFFCINRYLFEVTK
ncbi:MAG: methyltransferase domain-containing protein [Cycloclasticus sp.]|jgi:ubiquinone/menaquinone biosynthesis C-methylase UbiE|nr:methyltransferase domain-containing protein [Cycloclasticus sp.]